MFGETLETLKNIFTTLKRQTADAFKLTCYAQDEL